MAILKTKAEDPLIQIFLHQRFRNILSFSFAFVSNFIASLLEGISFAFFLFGFNAIIGGESLSLPFARFFYGFFEGREPLYIFVLSVISGIGLQVARSGFNYVGQVTMTFLGTRLQTEGQRRIYDQIFRLSFRSISRYKVGDLVEYAKTPVLLIVPLMDSFNRIVLSLLMIVALIIFMIFISPLLTLIMAVLFTVVAISQKGIIKKISSLSTLNSNNIVELTKHTVQNLYGLKAVLTFGRQKSILNKIDESLEKIAKSTVKTNALNQFISPFNEMIGISFVGVSLLAAVFILKSSEAMMPCLLTFLTLTYRLGNRIPMLMGAWGSIAFYMGSILRLREILNNKDKEFLNENGKDFTTFCSQIDFKEISLTYEQKPAVNNISLTIPKGSVVALVGASGAGKSSLVDLLIRLYEPTHGKIEIDGVDLSTYNVNSWRKVLGVVSQDAIIFNESIEDNILFGMKKANEHQLMEAAKMAGAHDFIMELPHQYKTIVGERGYKLSGGEKQRIALARALIRDPEILILDEATSNLDSHSEQVIQRALEKLKKKKTIIMVAHRLSTITMADQIYVIENGQVTEQGSHAQLLKKNGSYHYYWSLQSKASLSEMIDDLKISVSKIANQ